MRSRKRGIGNERNDGGKTHGARWFRGHCPDTSADTVRTLSGHLADTLSGHTSLSADKLRWINDLQRGHTVRTLSGHLADTRASLPL